MSLDRLELLEVRLGSGKVYLVPRALLENLVQALPVSAPQLIVSASPSGGPLDPSGLPSEAGENWGGGSCDNSMNLRNDHAFQGSGGGSRDEKGPPKGSLTPGYPDRAPESLDMLWTC